MTSPHMRLHQRPVQSAKQTQRLILSPEMQQAIHLLQLPVQELSQRLDEEIRQNPVLEEEEDGPVGDLALDRETQENHYEANGNEDMEADFTGSTFAVLKMLDDEYRENWIQSAGFTPHHTPEEEELHAFLEASIPNEESLYDHLTAQAHQTLATAEQLRLASSIIGNLDERGYLDTSLQELATANNASLSALERVLVVVQTFDPYGVGARNLQESLLIQLRCQGKEGTLAYQIVEKQYDNLLHNHVPAIQKAFHCSAVDVRQAVEKHICRLDLHPGTLFSKQMVQPISPDVTVRMDAHNQWVIEINEEMLPPLHVNSKYLRMLEQDDTLVPSETKDYIRQKIGSSRWLQRNIRQRNQTLLRLTECLIRRQNDFLASPSGKLKPLTMKVVAEELGLHESTIARAVSGKYINAPRGLMPLRSFFTNGLPNSQGKDISSRTVKEWIREIIAGEDKRKPLSDEEVSQFLHSKGITCARRTVAKYRGELTIPSTSQRRKWE